MKKSISIILVLLISVLFIFTGCDDNVETDTTDTKINNTTSESEQKDIEEGEKILNEFDYKAAAEKQFALPKEGETIAIIKVKGYGDVKVKFFPEVAPKAVENFTTHAKNGYYNGVTFHRVIEEFMIQGGDPEGTGMGGESIWGTGFGPELALELVPYRGSLCMAMSSLPNSIGSQFFITQANYSDYVASYYKSGGFPEGLLEQYKNYGGYLSLYLQYTVFGQVYEGMDVVDSISRVETYSEEEGQADKPKKDVIIESIEVTTYKGK